MTDTRYPHYDGRPAQPRKSFAQMQQDEIDRQTAILEAAETARSERISRAIAADQAARAETERRIAREKAEIAEQAAQVQRDLATLQADAFERRVRARFDKMVPGGSDSDYRALRPQLIAEQAYEDAEPERRMRANMRRMI